MSRPVPTVTDSLADSVHAELAPDEQIVSLLRCDLDHQHRFVESTLVLTSRRLLAVDQSGAVSRTWPLDEHLRLQPRQMGGVRCLDLSYRAESGDSFRFTAARARDAAAFLERFDQRRAAIAEPLHDSLPESLPPADDNPPIRARQGTKPLLRLLGFARPQLRAGLIGIALTLATTAAGLVPPYLTMPLVDRVLVPAQQGTLPAGRFAPSPLAQVSIYLLGLFGAATAAWLLSWAQGWVLARATERVSAELRNRAFAHLQQLSLTYFGGKRTGDLVARIGTDTDRLCSFFSDTLVDFVTDVLMIVGTIAVLFWLDPVLALATMASCPPITWLILRLRGRLSGGFLRGGRAWSAMTSILTDAIPGIRVVKAFHQEQREVARFTQANRRIVEVNDRINALWTFFWPMVAFLNQIGLLVVWVVGSLQVFGHHVTIGVLTAFIAYIGRFYARLESMSRMLSATERASASAQRLLEILDRRPTVTDPAVSREVGPIEATVELVKVGFYYGTRKVLSDVSFQVGPGEMVGIVGHTGSGKSTIANLICRFYDPSEGVVRLGGNDLRQLAIRDLRRHIAVVLQDPFLFFGTVAENIAYGRADADRAAIVGAARTACAHEFVLRLPEAYDSLVGERGQSLSGGERQRIAIARAVLVDPAILLLDEATSAVDVQTERDIQRALDAAVRGRTTIAIAHRLSTVARATRLVVLRQGQVVEIGTHQELLERNGEYARLWHAQAFGSPRESLVEELRLDLEQRPVPEPSESDLTSEGPVRFDFDELRLHAEGEAILGLLTRDGERIGLVHPVRCFPLSDPEGPVCFVDAHGHERACVGRLEALPTRERELVSAALALREFVPTIEHIDRIEVSPARSTWHVTTDRGRTSFSLEHEENIRDLGHGRLVLTDASGMRFLVNDVERLDEASRRSLARFC